MKIIILNPNSEYLLDLPTVWLVSPESFTKVLAENNINWKHVSGTWESEGGYAVRPLGRGLEVISWWRNPRTGDKWLVDAIISPEDYISSECFASSSINDDILKLMKENNCKSKYEVLEKIAKHEIKL
jgi:hypothetical protein